MAVVGFAQLHHAMFRAAIQQRILHGVGDDVDARIKHRLHVHGIEVGGAQMVDFTCFLQFL
jgi:hypothetical protein